MACQFSSCFHQQKNRKLQKVDNLADTIVEQNQCEAKGLLGKVLLKDEDHDKKTCFSVFRALLANACTENDELTENLIQSWRCSSNDGLISLDEHFPADGRIALEPHLLGLMEKLISSPVTSMKLSFMETMTMMSGGFGSTGSTNNIFA